MNDPAIQAADTLPHAFASVLLDEMGDGLLVCDGEARLAWKNFAARRTLENGRGLRVEGDRLAACDTDGTVALRKAISNACGRGLRAMVALEAQGERLFAVVLPLAGAAGDAPRAAILCGRSQVCPELAMEMLSNMHELTSSERRVLAALLAGQRPGAVAHSNGVEVSTVRTQVGMLRAKLGVSSIVDLTRLAARLPAVVTAVRCITQPTAG